MNVASLYGVSECTQGDNILVHRASRAASTCTGHGHVN